VARQAQAAPHGRSNKRMHATADTEAVIISRGLWRRVMRSVRSPERNSLMARQAQAGALGRSNSGMHPTADTTALM
jgi:hypothetical protein